MTEDVRRLRPAQARAVLKAINEPFQRYVWRGSALSAESLTLAAILAGIDELTAKPGEPEFCRECECWGPKITHTGPDAYGVKGKWTEYPERCNHKEAREGFCPEEGERCVKKQKPEKQCETCKYLRRRRVGLSNRSIRVGLCGSRRRREVMRMAEPDYDFACSWDWANYYREGEGKNLRIPKPKAQRQRRLRLKREEKSRKG